MAVGDDTAPAAPGKKAALHKKSDLGVRSLSAIVMVAVASAALWLGGYVWTAFVALVAVGVLWEWVQLSRAFAISGFDLAYWVGAGVLYVGTASTVLVVLLNYLDISVVLYVVLAVIATDLGAYFAGRTFGGPKIAPRISPSKTWAGLGGGVLGASLVPLGLIYWQAWGNGPIAEDVFAWLATHWGMVLARSLAVGALIAITAQTGDFFESWMKRRAGVKDSGNLIPGHGGLFDRVDGLLAVLFVIGIVAGMVRFL